MTSPDYTTELQRWRDERNHFMAHHYATPLSDDDIAVFNGLRYFPADPAMVFPADLDPEETKVAIEASTGAVSDYAGAGTVAIRFPIGRVAMQVLRGEEDDLFIPFRDRTCGKSTYSGGRYVGVERTADGFIVDFNKAINPYCAYDPDFSCPLPPPENRLHFAVEAGELDYP